MTTPTPPSAPQKFSGVAPLSHLGVIRATGPDAGVFLQGQLTQDVLSMGLDTARLAAFCNAKGRMQASFWVFKRKSVGTDASVNGKESDEFLMICSVDLLAQTLKRLSMFVMRAKVKLTDASGEMVLYGLAGDATQTGAVSQDNIWAKSEFEGQTMVALYPGAGCELAVWCAPVGTPAPTGPLLPASVWMWLTVRSGVAMLTQPIFEAFVPQMLNYESIGGVSFKKGCYPGQEVVARSQFRGTLKRRAYVVHAASETAEQPQPGREVFESSDADQPCGVVAASAANPIGGFDAIVVLQTSAAVGGRLVLGDAQGPGLTVLPLPYPLLEDI